MFEATLAETRTYEPFALQRSLWLPGVDIYNIGSLNLHLLSLTQFNDSTLILILWI